MRRWDDTDALAPLSLLVETFKQLYARLRGGRSPSHPYSPFPEYSVDDWVLGLIPVPVGPVGSAFGGSICSPSDMSWGEGGRGTQDRSGGGQ
jgi:hypothetical protein